MDFALGLCVIGTEVHDSSRITLQLDGRSGRQGQFGLTLVLLSLEDRLVNLDAEAIRRLTGCRGTDAAGRVCYQGQQVSRRIQALQDAADREGEAQRALMQDYAAEFDRQTGLYHRRREELIAASNGDRRDVQRLVADAVRRVASRLAAAYLGEDVDGDYAPRFQRLREDMLRDYGVDCEELHGAGLHLLPIEIASSRSHSTWTGRLRRGERRCSRSWRGCSTSGCAPICGRDTSPPCGTQCPRNCWEPTATNRRWPRTSVAATTS